MKPYGKIYRLGTPETAGVFDGIVYAQEKIDGSQISFWFEDGQLKTQSKNQMVDPDDPGLFKEAVDSLTQWAYATDCTPGETIVFRGEYLRKKRHNVLTYDRVPAWNVVVFDVEVNGERCPFRLVDWCTRAGLEYIPYEDTLDGDNLLSRPSMLGGRREGFVYKNYETGVFAKVVAQEFKELTESRPKRLRTDALDLDGVSHELRSEARWEKARQYLRDRGELQGNSRDIGKVIRRVHEDILDEEWSRISERLAAKAWKHVSKGVTTGLADWYHEKLREDVQT